VAERSGSALLGRRQAKHPTAAIGTLGTVERSEAGNKRSEGETRSPGWSLRCRFIWHRDETNIIATTRQHATPKHCTTHINLVHALMALSTTLFTVDVTSRCVGVVFGSVHCVGVVVLLELMIECISVA